MKNENYIKSNIEKVLKKPPSLITRIATFLVISILFICFLELDRIEIQHPLDLHGSIICVSSNLDNTTHVVLNLSSQLKKIEIKDSMAILNLVTSNKGAFELSIQGTLDSLNQDKGLVYFSFFDPMTSYLIIKKLKSAKIQIKHSESSYLQSLLRNF
jgi:hypothetical protein